MLLLLLPLRPLLLFLCVVVGDLLAVYIYHIILIIGCRVVAGSRGGACVMCWHGLQERLKAKLVVRSILAVPRDLK